MSLFKFILIVVDVMFSNVSLNLLPMIKLKQLYTVDIITSFVTAKVYQMKLYAVTPTDRP